VTCVKLLLNTSCEKIMYGEEYAVSHSAAKEVWLRGGRIWVRHTVR
jgi:hypothetical protein